jgi:hypothetical protein
MASSALKTSTVRFSKIQVSRPRLRCKNATALHKAMQVIHRSGQQRPLIIDPDGWLLSDTTSYLALKALKYDFVKVFTLANPSPVAVRAVSRLLIRWVAIRSEAVAFNAALASLDGLLEIDTQELVLELVPVVIDKTGEVSLRLLPALASDEGDHMPLDA